MYTFSENVQRSAESWSATDLDQASLGSEACVKGEREREREREREGGGGGLKARPHFALQILVRTAANGNGVLSRFLSENRKPPLTVRVIGRGYREKF